MTIRHRNIGPDPSGLWLIDLDTGERLGQAFSGGDGVVIDPGASGSTIATDLIAGVEYQRVKIVEGADNTNDGDVSASNPLPVDVSDNAVRDLGKVDIAVFDSPLPAGANNIGDVDVLTIAALTATGTITAISQSVTLDVQGYGAVAIQVKGTWVATLGFDGTVDGTNWQNLQAVPSGSGSPVTTTASNGIWLVECGGLNQIRVFADAFTSGTATVNLQANVAGAKGATDIAVTSLPANASVNVAQVAGTATSVNAGNADVGTQRVVLATDQSVVSIDDNAGSITVDGTVTADPSASDYLTIVGHTRNEAFKESSAIGGELDDTATVAATEGNISPVRITAQRGLHVNLRDNSGTELASGGGTEAAALRVTVANDSTGVVSVDDGGGALTVDGTVTANAGTGTFAIGGVAAHDAVVSGNPVLLAGEARTTLPTAVADGDVTRLHCDDLGRLVTTPFVPRDRITHARVVLSTTTETTLIAAGGAGVFRDVVFLSVTNESATKVRLDLRDSTAGTIRFSLALAADGGGGVIPLPVPLTQATANNVWTIQLSSAVTSVYVTAIAIDQN